MAPSFSHRPVSPRRHSSPTGESANWRPLRPDAATRAAFKADAEFVEEMKKRAMASDSALEISAAEAERIRGAAKMYEQSGFKVDAKALPEINKTQSIFGQ